MSYLETTKYPADGDSSNFYIYDNKPVSLITIFSDINFAIIEDEHGNILEVPADQLLRNLED